MRSRPPTSAPAGFRALFRYRKGDRTRTYGLNALDERSIEVWVIASGRPPTAASARKLVRLAGEDELVVILDDIEQQLRLGHWSPMP